MNPHVFCFSESRSAKNADSDPRSGSAEKNCRSRLKNAHFTYILVRFCLVEKKIEKFILKMPISSTFWLILGLVEKCWKFSSDPHQNFRSDPDLHQNNADPKHCNSVFKATVRFLWKTHIYIKICCRKANFS